MKTSIFFIVLIFVGTAFATITEKSGRLANSYDLSCVSKHNKKFNVFVFNQVIYNGEGEELVQFSIVPQALIAHEGQDYEVAQHFTLTNKGNGFFKIKFDFYDGDGKKIIQGAFYNCTGTVLKEISTFN